MHVAKRLALGLLSPLFIALLFTTAFDVGFVNTATHPAKVKQLVAESGIYSSVIPSALQQAGTISTSFGNVPSTDPAVQKAAKVALPPQYIQENTEAAIDNVYQWLDGKIAAPNFSIDLTGAKTLFANNIADSALKRMNSLPACTTAQSLAIARSGQFDAYNATCLPKGVSAATIAEQIKSSIVNGNGFLGSTAIVASNIKNEGSGQSVFSDQLKQAPAVYQKAKKTPVILIVMTILAGAGIVFLSSTWQKGLRHIGINLVVIGVVMLIFSWAFNWTVSNKITPKIKVSNAILQQDIRKLITDIAQQVDKNYWLFGGIYLTFGVGAIAASQIFLRKHEINGPAADSIAGKNQPQIAESPKDSDKE